MKKVFMAYSWLLLTVGIILISVATIHFVTFTKKRAQIAEISKNATPTASASPTIPTPQVKGMSTIVETQDARPLIISNFLDRYDSVLKPYDYFGELFVKLADTYGFDFRLLPAIAMQESNLCKKIPEGTYNCLGFGIHSKGTLAFESFEANFERAAKELKANYIDIGLTTPEMIMSKYTPSSNGSWAESVNQWMAEMRYDDRQKGRELKKDASVLEFAKDE